MALCWRPALATTLPGPAMNTSSRLVQIASVLSVSPGYFFGDITAIERKNDEAVAEMEWIALLMEPGVIALIRA